MAVLPQAAHADLATQRKNIVGDWDCGDGVIRVEEVSDDEVLAYICDRKWYFATNGHCRYKTSFLDRYDYRFGGYCNTEKPYCHNAIKASSSNRNILIQIIDPLLWHDYPNSGESDVCDRI